MPELTFIDNRSLTNTENNFTTNYLKAMIDDFEFECPYLCSNKSDYKKSHDTQIDLESKIFYYYIDQTASNAKPLTDVTKRTAIRKDFENIVNKKDPKITGINFYYDSNHVDERTRQLSLEIQTELQTTFLSDMEPDKNQSALEFERQLDNFLEMETDQIKCPTISLRTENPELFEEKIKLVIKKKFKVFNVEWGGFSQYPRNMSILSSELANKKILCNIISVKPLRSNAPPFASNHILAGLIGAHLISPGYLRPNAKLPAIMPPGKIFNTQTWCYEESERPRNIIHTESNNLIFNSLREIGLSVVDQTPHSDFVPQEFQLNHKTRGF